MEWSNRFITFINVYATALFENDSKFLDKWEKNNNREINKVLCKLVEFIDDGDIDAENLADKIPEFKEDLKMYFTSVYEFVKREIENYKHYVKAVKYSQGITEIKEEKIEYLKGYHIPKYDNNVPYDKYSMKMKEYESRLSR